MCAKTAPKRASVGRVSACAKKPPVAVGWSVGRTLHSAQQSVFNFLQGLLVCAFGGGILTVGYACVECGRHFAYGVAREEGGGGSISTLNPVASELCKAALVINVTFDFCNVGAAAFGGSFANQSCLWGSSAAAAKAYPNSNVVAIFDEDVVTWHASAAAAAHHHRGGGSLGYS